jgi:hypothetical protein
VREVDFRDGKRLIPDHLADMMDTLKTHTITYEQAVEKANWKLADDFAKKSFDDILRSHFQNGGNR